MSLIATRVNPGIVVLLIAVTAFAFGPRVHSQQGQSLVLSTSAARGFWTRRRLRRRTPTGSRVG